MIRTNIRLNLIEEYIPSNRTYDVNVKKLDWNECNLKFDIDLKNKLISSIKNINFSEYPNINNEKLLKKLSKYCNVTKESVQIFNGSDSALHYIFATFLNIDTKVLIFYPNYNQIETFIKLYSDNISYSKIKDPFGVHEYEVNEVEKNDVIYISNPNNPTGHLLEPEFIEDLLVKFPNKLFIIDEAYYEFAKKSCSSYVKKYKNLIVTRTFSKALSLASVRLGYICADKNLIKSINKIRNTKEVNSFAQNLGEVILDNLSLIDGRINKINRNKHKFERVLDENNIEYIKSQTNFILIRIKNSKKIISDLKNENILVRDRSMFEGLENTIRITIGEWGDMKKISKIILNNK
jgi:histidinol-phosphate aminotransferase